MIAKPNPNWQAGVKERYDAFAYAWATNGQNGAAAARTAGYSVNRDFQTANRLVRIGYIKDKIAEILDEIKTKAVATKEQRQNFWSKVMQGKLEGVGVNMGDRLRASELLGKSEADFTENIHTTTELQRELSEREESEAKRLANIRLRQGA